MKLDSEQFNYVNFAREICLTIKKIVFREMLHSSWWLFLIHLVVIVNGKLDEQHIDKHNEHHSINGSYPEGEQRKAYHDHDDLFGAKMCKFVDILFKLHNFSLSY